MLPNRKLNRPERDLSEQAFYMEPQTVPAERYITTKHGQVLFAMRCANDKDLVQAAVTFGIDLTEADYTGMDLEGVRFRQPVVPTYLTVLELRGISPALSYSEPLAAALAKREDEPTTKLKDMPR